eukprot:SAG11_NODE_167_length_13647_cov_7.705049_8_plen_121_part_00
MPTYLDWLPDDVLNMVYKYVNDRAIADALKIAKRKQIPCTGYRTNNRVIYSWMNNKPWHSLSMRTDGKSIYSFNWKIGETDEKNTKLLKDYTAKGLGYYSHTTSHHVNLARPYADVVVSK